MTTLITGANRGIGAALAAELESRGTDVLRTARDASTDIVLDVTDPKSVATLAHQLEGKTIDMLVCNAGVFLDKGLSGADLTPEMWAKTFDVNVTGVFLTIQAVLPVLKAAQTPKIAIISSQMASDTRAPGGSYIYRASKAAVLNLGRNMAMDLKPEGVALGIYEPGWVRTDMGGDAAPLSVEESVHGLVDRFEQLSMDRTGEFLSWHGGAHPF